MKFVGRWIMNLLWWDWAHVGIFKGIGGNFTYIHLFESRWGSRRAHFVSTDTYPGDNWKNRAKRTAEYQTRIYPWLKGAADPDIPTFNDVYGKKEEFINKLKGKKYPRVINND